MLLLDIIRASALDITPHTPGADHDPVADADADEAYPIGRRVLDGAKSDSAGQEVAPCPSEDIGGVPLPRGRWGVALLSVVIVLAGFWGCLQVAQIADSEEAAIEAQRIRMQRQLQTGGNAPYADTADTADTANTAPIYAKESRP